MTVSTQSLEITSAHNCMIPYSRRSSTKRNPGKRISKSSNPLANTLAERTAESGRALAGLLRSQTVRTNRIFKRTHTAPATAAQERPQREEATTSRAAEGGGPSAPRASRPLPAAGPAPGEAPFAPPRARARPQLPRPPSCGKCGSFRVPHPLGSTWQLLRRRARARLGPRAASGRRVAGPSHSRVPRQARLWLRAFSGSKPPALPLTAGEGLPRHQYVLDKSCQV